MMWPYEIEDEALLLMETLELEKAAQYTEIDGTMHELWDKGVFFINNSGQTIDNVCYSVGGFITACDDVVTTSSTTERCYENVLHGEAVQFDFTSFYDGDYLISYYFQIQANHLRETNLETDLEKGGSLCSVLLWADLPEPFKNPDYPTQSLGAIEAAQKFISATGKPLPKSIPINKGDLRYGDGDGRLAEQGIHLKRTQKRRGKVIMYEFSNEKGKKIYHTVVWDDALAFINALKQG